MRKALAIILVAAAAASCGHKVESVDVDDGAVHLIGSGGTATVQMITLDDGTVCAALVGSGKAGIDCNWK